MTTAEILAFVGEAVKALVDVAVAAAKGPEPPTLAELQARIDAAIKARAEAWLPSAQEDADKASQAAADAAFRDP